MLFFREVDKKIKDHEKRKVRLEIKKESEHKLEIDKPKIKPKPMISPHQSGKEEIFEFPVKKIRKTIEVSC